MHWTGALANRSFPSDTVLADEWKCVGCGYNLRGARIGGQCPECGAQVEQSIAILSQPERVATNLRTIAITFLSDLAILLWGVKLMLGASSALFFGFLILSAGRAYRLFAAWQLKHRCSLNRHASLQFLLHFLWLCVVADTALLLGSFGYQFYELTSGPGMFSSRMVSALTALWLIAAFCSHACVGVIGLRLSRLLDYENLPREFVIQLVCLIATSLIIVFVAAAFVAGSVRGFVVTGAIGLLALLVTLGYSVVATLHLANAADKQRDSAYDLLEIDSVP